MMIWSAYNIVAPLLGVFVVWGFLGLTGDKVHLFYLFRDGQVAFLCTVLAAATINDLNETHKLSGGALSGLLLVIVVSLVIYMAAIINTRRENQENLRRAARGEQVVEPDMWRNGVCWSSLLVIALTILQILPYRDSAGLFHG